MMRTCVLAGILAIAALQCTACGDTQLSKTDVEKDVSQQALESLKPESRKDATMKTSCARQDEHTYRCAVRVVIESKEEGVMKGFKATSEPQNVTATVDGKTVVVDGLGTSETSSPDDSANSAKSDARNMVSQVESCDVDTQDYRRCRSASELGDTGLSIGSAPGSVEVTQAGPSTFTIVAHSNTGAGYTIAKAPDGSIVRSCSAGTAGCSDAGAW